MFVTDMAAKRAELTPDKPAFIDVESGRTLTFEDVDALAEGAAAGLADLGVARGDRVAILCQNRPEFFVALFACQKAGFILTPLNWRQPAAELQPIVEMVRPRAVLFDAGFAETARALCRAVPMLPVALDAPQEDETAFSGFGRRETTRCRAIDGAAPWYLLFTSGTTGLPKAVIQTAGMTWVNAVNMSQAARLTSADVGLNYLPLFHTAGVNLYTMPLYLIGATSYILKKFEPDAALDLIADGRITTFFGVPAIYQAFSRSARIDDIDLSRLGGWGCGGAPLPAPLVRFFAERGAIVCNGFGMTETGPTVFLQNPEDVESTIGSVGRAQMLCDARIDGPAETGGELQIRGPGITPGYYDDAEATAAAFTEDGWLKTGDVARCDADGNVFIIDRIKDMYISGGENVYPAEVERVLHTHPDILDVAVVGMADEKWGEVGAAFLTTRDGAEFDPSALTRWCRERLAAYKVPKRFTYLAEFPRTAAGKVKKHELKAMLS
jgi:fatty-acyl-CoA synthase